MNGKRFWVFFDTATRPDYYQDVHKVLALPDGALLEYQYRDLRMESEAIAASQKELHEVPRQVLIIYAQWTHFKRGDSDPEGLKPSAEMRYQALRRGQLVALWRDGERASFQFRLDAYPRADPTLLTPILDPLSERSAIPYNSWVAICDEEQALEQLVSEDPTKDWQEIVNRLSTTPMQFVDDKFLRFNAPGRNRFWTPAELRSKYRKRSGHPNALEHQYIVPERCEFSLRISTHEPVGANPGGVSTPVANFEAKVSENGPLLAPSPSSGSLRRTADTTINLESRHSAQAEAKVGRLIISSADALPAVPAGIEFSFALRLAAWKRILGVVLMALGTVTLTTAGLLFDEKEISVLAVVLMSIGAILVAGLGTFLTTGKWSFKT